MALIVAVPAAIVISAGGGGAPHKPPAPPAVTQAISKGPRCAGACARVDFDFDQRPRPPVILPLHPPFS